MPTNTDVNPNTMSREEFKRFHAKLQAGKIVTAIINSLNDRSGLGIDNLDSDVQDEIREEWTEIVLKGMAKL